MNKVALVTIVASLAVTALAQEKVKLNAKFSDLVSGSTSVNGTAKSPNIQMTPSRSNIGTQLAPPSRDLIGDTRDHPVPEPATMAVLGIGAAALLRRRRAR